MSGRPMTEEELAELSDDEISNMAMAPASAAPEAVPQEEVQEEGTTSAGTNLEADSTAASAPGSEDDKSGEDPEDPEASAAATVEAGGANPLGDDDGAVEKTPVSNVGAKEEKTPEAAKAEPAVDPKAGPDGLKKDGATTEKTGEAIDYKASYEKIMAPFKAAGKMVQLNSPEEVIQLMQMGAHYTKKMQALQPNLKLLKMLENNDLLDQTKLSFLIDVNRKDPAAIKKLVKDSGIDPIDIDVSADPEYRPGNYSVPDEEIAFVSTLEEVGSDPVGKNLIVEINKTWDKTSKDALWGEPHILRVLSEQKTNGIYDKISSEIERRRILGHYQNEPFLQVYQQVGQELQARGELTPQAPTTTAEPTPSREAPVGQPTQERRVVETRPAQPRTVQNNEQAKAASPSKAAPQKKASGPFNPLALSDEEFEKTAAMAGRL